MFKLRKVLKIIKKSRESQKAIRFQCEKSEDGVLKLTSMKKNVNLCPVQKRGGSLLIAYALFLDHKPDLDRVERLSNHHAAY